MHFQRILKEEILKHLKYFPSVVILGARQVGKTTLAKKIQESIDKESLYLDMELESDVNKLSEPEMFLKLNKDKCIIIDEVQRKPELFPLLRGLIDQDRTPGRFILLGSADTHLIRLSSESLAGRVSYTELTGFLYKELEEKHTLNKIWFRGGFPEAFLMKDNEIRHIWYNSFVKTVTERDLPQLGLKASSKTVSRCLRMIASNQGGLLNKSRISNSLGISNSLVSEILDYLESVFLIRVLEPYYANVGKRLTKSHKIYIRDSGLVHFLNGINDMNSLLGNQIVGSSWEGFCIEQIIGHLGDKYSYYFYRTQDQAESDLVICKNDKPLYCIEIKLTSKPKRTHGFTSVIKDLQADQNFILIPDVKTEYPLAENIIVTDLVRLLGKL